MNEILRITLEKNGYSSLNPMQKEFFKKYKENKSFVISAPTASGKTFVAEFLALKNVLEAHKKVIYTAPLKALASEHYKEWRKRYSSIGVKIALSTGDFDSSSKYLSRYNIIFTTNEKLDSLITHRAQWLNEIGLLIVDEVHEIGSSRGATLEAVIMKIRSMLPELKILALSATIPNADELAEWLNAELIVSNYRPIKLREGILFGKKVYFADGKKLVLKRDGYEGVLEDTIQKGKQILIFTNTRRNAELLAKKFSSMVYEHLTQKEKRLLEKISEKILNVLETPTEQCKTLAEIVKKGCAFHHAGLLSKQRSIIEDVFRAGKIKVVVATPTLALGVNMPAFRVLIASAYRYGNYGMELIPVSEYKQMAGRAGRPKYDDSGEAILVARSEPEKEEFMERYIKGRPEDIGSMLSMHIVLRMQVLSSIASGFVRDYISLEEFFASSFYAKQYRNLSELMEKIYEIIDDLISYGFINESETLTATKLGRRVAELYIDPESAHNMLGMLRGKLNELSMLFCLTNTSEFGVPPISKKLQQEMFEKLYELEEEFGIDATKEYFSNEYILNKIFGTLVLHDWINEKSEQSILEEYNIRPGILQAMLQVCDWLSYAASELAKLINEKENSIKMRILRERLKYGVKEELLPLVIVKHIGRVRARKLYRAGIRNVVQLKKIDVVDLGRIIGKGIAEKVKKELHAN